MTSQFRRFIALLLAFALLSSLSSAFASDNVPVFEATAASPSPDQTSVSISPEQMILNNVRNMRLDEDTLVTIQTVKELHDFSGNLYYIAEFAESGYLICHAATGETIEHSTSAPSPYAGYTEGLFYCGPTFYYIERDSEYVHPITSESLSAENEVITEALRASSDAFNQQIEQTASITPISGTLDNTQSSNIPILENESVNIVADTQGTSHRILGSTIIRNLNTREKFGHYSGYDTDTNGACGYIAGGMMLLWHDRIKNDQIINDYTYINRFNNSFRGAGFASRLREFGYSDRTEALGIIYDSLRNAIDGYLASIHVTATRYAPTGVVTPFDARQVLKNLNVPVVVFGRLLDVTDSSGYVAHAVLAYGYDADGNLIVHYGWPNYNEVTLHYSLLGALLYYYNFSSPAIELSDVASSNWAYPAAQYAARYGLLGTSSKRFSPDSYTTRGQFVNALYKLSGSPQYSTTWNNEVENNFTDFNSSSSYHDAAVWAYKKGILNGITSTTMGLSSTLTREQAAAFLYRYSNVTNCSFPNTSGPSASSFSDYSSISKFARTPMNWATERYLMQGSGGYLRPKDQLTRAQTAQLLYNMNVKGRPTSETIGRSHS